MGQRPEFSPRTGLPIALPPGAKAYDDNDNEVPLSNVVQSRNQGTIVKPIGPRRISFEGNTITVPNDATDDEIKQVLSKYGNSGTAPTAAPNPSTFEEGDSPNDLSLGDKLYKKYYEDPATNAVNAVQAGQYKRAASQGIKAASVFAAPYVAGSLVTNPVSTITGLATGALGAKGGSAVAKHFGADEDTQDLVGDATGLASGVAGSMGSGSLVRGAGRGLSSVESIPDLPTSTGSRVLNMGARVVNAFKRPAAAAGQRMSNYGIPTMTEQVYPGEVPKAYHNPLAEIDPELPTPVQPSGQAHYNDVTTELPDGLKPPTRDPIWKKAGVTPTAPDTPQVPVGRDAFSRRNPSGMSDAMDAQSRGAGYKPPPSGIPINQYPQSIDIMRKSPITPSKAILPDPATEQLKMDLSRPIGPIPPKRAPINLNPESDKFGLLPENASPAGNSDLPHALDTDPYNQTLDELQPFRRRRGDPNPTNLGEGEIVHPDNNSNIPNPYSRFTYEPETGKMFNSTGEEILPEVQQISQRVFGKAYQHLGSTEKMRFAEGEFDNEPEWKPQRRLGGGNTEK